MEIHSLRASISEKDLNDLASRHLPEDQPIEDLKITVAKDGVHIKGVYPLFVNVGFETHWEIDVRQGKPTAFLAGFKALGIPGSVFKSAILKYIGEAAKNEKWLVIENERMVLDLDGLLRANGLDVRTNVTKVTCQDGLILIESENSS